MAIPFAIYTSLPAEIDAPPASSLTAEVRAAQCMYAQTLLLAKQDKLRAALQSSLRMVHLTQKTRDARVHVLGLYAWALAAEVKLLLKSYAQCKALATFVLRKTARSPPALRPLQLRMADVRDAAAAGVAQLVTSAQQQEQLRRSASSPAAVPLHRTLSTVSLLQRALSSGGGGGNVNSFALAAAGLLGATLSGAVGLNAAGSSGVSTPPLNSHGLSTPALATPVLAAPASPVAAATTLPPPATAQQLLAALGALAGLQWQLPPGELPSEALARALAQQQQQQREEVPAQAASEDASTRGGTDACMREEDSATGATGDAPQQPRPPKQQFKVQQQQRKDALPSSSTCAPRPTESPSLAPAHAAEEAANALAMLASSGRVGTPLRPPSLPSSLPGSPGEHHHPGSNSAGSALTKVGSA